MEREKIILDELNRQIAVRVKEKIDRMLSVHAYLTSEEVARLVNSKLANVPEELDKDEMFDEVIEKLYNYLDEYEVITLQNGSGYIVNKDRVSMEIFVQMESVSERDNCWYVINRYLEGNK